MRRGGFGKESSDQSKKDVPVTPVMKVLHPVTRAVIGLAFAAGPIASLFTWDWRYFAASCFVVAGGLIVGPWVWPHEKVRIEVDPTHDPLGEFTKRLDSGKGRKPNQSDDLKGYGG